MCSHPFLVRIFQIGELSLSLEVLEPCHTLEIMIQLHLDSLRKVIENLGGGGGGGGLICMVNHYFLG